MQTELVIFGSGEEPNYRFFMTRSRYWNATADCAHQTALVKPGKLRLKRFEVGSKVIFVIFARDVRPPLNSRKRPTVFAPGAY